MPNTPTASELLVELVRAPSVTPAAGPALEIVARHLQAGGFAVERPVFTSDGKPPVENLFAAVGNGERHLTLAGHVDVVPPGPEASWQHPPFAAEIVDGVLYGRGAVDMKGGLAAMIGGGASLRDASRRGFRRAALVPGDGRRGGRRRERHGEAARMGDRARREILRRARRRADKRRGARRPDQGRPPGLLLSDARRGGPAGPFGLSAPRGKSDPRHHAASLCAPVRAARFGLGAFRAVVVRSRQRRRRQSGMERDPGECQRALQQPLQRSLDAREPRSRDPSGGFRRPPTIRRFPRKFRCASGSSRSRRAPTCS